MRKLAALSATAIIALLAAVPAHAARGDAVIRDCTDDGRIGGSYSQEDYRSAISNLPADVDEYTDCREVIRRAQRAAASSRGGGSGSGSSTSSPGSQPVPGAAQSPAEDDAAIDDALEEGDDQIDVDGEDVEPGETGGAAREVAAVGNGLPLPLLVSLLAVAGSGLALLGASGPLGGVRGRVGSLAARIASKLRRG